jgi:hypothetical protein
MAEGPTDVEELTADKLNLLRYVIRREVNDYDMEPNWSIVADELELPYWSVVREGTAIWEKDFCSSVSIESCAVYPGSQANEDVSVTDSSVPELVSQGRDPTLNLNPYHYPNPNTKPL